MDINKENIRVCEIDDNMVSDRERCKGKIGVAGTKMNIKKNKKKEPNFTTSNL